MATQATINVDTSNFLSINRENVRIALGENDFIDGDFTNATGVELILEAGTVLCRNSATGAIELMKSAGINGTNLPLGVLPEERKLAIAETQNIPITVSGMVSLNRLVFDGADTIDTVVDGRRYLDLIPAATKGIELVESTELSKFDN